MPGSGAWASASGLRVWGLGFQGWVWGSDGLGFRVKGSGCDCGWFYTRRLSAGFREGLGFRAEGAGLRTQSSWHGRILV